MVIDTENPCFLFQMCRQIITKCPRCGLMSDVEYDECPDAANGDCTTIGIETRDLICDDCLKKEDEDN